MISYVGKLQTDRKLSASCVDVMRQLACLFALSKMEDQHIGDLMQDGYLNGMSLDGLRRE